MHPDQQLDDLFQEYRQGMSALEPSANFMPRLWSRIDSRRSFALQFKRVTQIFVASAALLCLLFTGIMVIPRSTAASHHATYLDILAEAHPTENLAAQGIAHLDSPEASR